MARVALVTGAARGIGRAIALDLAQDHRVAITWRNTPPDDLPEGALALQADLTDPGSAETVVAAVIDRFGRLDVIVNNAGLVQPTPLELDSACRGSARPMCRRMLRDAAGGWFHYSVDYRIGTRYMGEYIADNFKREAMKVPLPARAADDRQRLHRVEHHLRQPRAAVDLPRQARRPGEGRPALRGIHAPAGQHRAAEIAAMLDTARFIDRAPRSTATTTSSATRGLDLRGRGPRRPRRPGADALAAILMVWIEGSDAHTAELVRRFDRAPKPMYYQPPFLEATGPSTARDRPSAEDAVDPDAFVRWTYARALAHRQPRYRRHGPPISAAHGQLPPPRGPKRLPGPPPVRNSLRNRPVCVRVGDEDGTTRDNEARPTLAIQSSAEPQGPTSQGPSGTPPVPQVRHRDALRPPRAGDAGPDARRRSAPRRVGDRRLRDPVHERAWRRQPARSGGPPAAALRTTPQRSSPPNATPAPRKPVSRTSASPRPWPKCRRCRPCSSHPMPAPPSWSAASRSSRRRWAARSTNATPPEATPRC
jgi:hypothetical protein